MSPELNPVPPEALRRLVQAASEITTALSPTPVGKAWAASMEATLAVLDAYRAEFKAANQG